MQGKGADLEEEEDVVGNAPGADRRFGDGGRHGFDRILSLEALLRGLLACGLGQVRGGFGLGRGGL